MNRILLSLCTMGLLLLSVSAQAQCTPDLTTPDSVGLYPDTLPDGTIGQPYEQVITVVMPKDTVVDAGPFGMLNIDICEVFLDSIPDLPAGMDFECSTPDCIFKIDHSPDTVNRVCARVFGTPTEAVMNDTLIVYAHVIPGEYDAAMDTCEALQLQLPDSLTNIEFEIRLFLSDNNTALEPAAWMEHIQLAPNPSLGQSELSLNLPQGRHAEIVVQDLMGRELQRFDTQPGQSGTQRFLVGQANWAKGVYLVRVHDTQRRQGITRKLIIQ